MYRKRTKKGRFFALFLAFLLMMAPAFSSYADNRAEESATVKEDSETGENPIAIF